ncbi:hypothetical protein GCM10011579_065620 [Streptomyces albiflavescens]|uniref:DUF11 domain-containing protein n=1 Tax=Streptomyces albiflavescens TaxID=1623582 RepID=A0A917YA93_9ACTN|nr:DUF11 domain-containing protein [Streptomyces albiflavescens]GGN80237.1 hypothetical protein GCM10011579_065620 [Streptomyces albiflavescens]
MTTTATPGGLTNSLNTVQHEVVTVGAEDAPGVGTVPFHHCPPPIVTANGGGCSADGTLVSTSTLDANGRASSATVGGEGGTYCRRAEFTPSANDHHYLSATHTNATTECFTIAPPRPRPPRPPQPPPSVDLSVRKTDTPDPVAAGQNLTYTIRQTNNGPDTADGVQLTDLVPAGMTFLSLAAPAGWTTTRPPASGTGRQGRRRSRGQPLPDRPGRHQDQLPLTHAGLVQPRGQPEPRQRTVVEAGHRTAPVAGEGDGHQGVTLVRDAASAALGVARITRRLCDWSAV